MYTQLQLIQRRVERSSAQETSRGANLRRSALSSTPSLLLKPRPIIHHQSSIVRGHWGFNDGDHIVVLIAFTLVVLSPRSILHPRSSLSTPWSSAACRLWSPEPDSRERRTTAHNVRGKRVGVRKKRDMRLLWIRASTTPPFAHLVGLLDGLTVLTSRQECMIAAGMAPHQTPLFGRLASAGLGANESRLLRLVGNCQLHEGR